VQRRTSDEHPHAGANPLFHDHVVCPHFRVSCLNVNDDCLRKTNTYHFLRLTGGWKPENSG
jgi:hypothetical protein